MNKSGLLVRLAFVIIFAALAVGFVTGQIFYRITYLDETASAERSIGQLFNSVSRALSTAVYVGDMELTKEVIDGLMSNDTVEGVKVKTAQKQEMMFGNVGLTSKTFIIQHPFSPEASVGEVILYPDSEVISNRAKAIGFANAKTLFVQAAFLTIVAIFIAYYLITRPMINISKELHKIEPGQAHRIDIPEFHKSSELGLLVNDINNLLERSEAQLKEERGLRKEIEKLEQRFRMLFDNSVSPIVLLEPKGNILLFNDSFNQLVSRAGLKFKRNFGELLVELFVDGELAIGALKESLSNDELATGELRIAAQTDAEIWVHLVVVSIVSEDYRKYYQITMHDISKRRVELELLNQQASYDGLTKLYNRQYAESKLSAMITLKQTFVIVLIDLNGFKKVNDEHGHEAGDELLVHVAKQIKACVRQDDMACRWGGDEFVLILNLNAKDPVLRIAEQLNERITAPYFLSKVKKQVTVGASMGVALYPQDGDTMDLVLHRADDAMYQVKREKETNPNMFIKFFEHRTG
ncbi:diguanylate cyclase [Pleionea litopenaei]|uniref:Diguanylate cyclase n=1 Tax=Pleionea litopenaei TaxID=3070815 RepID=A0AA51RT59_9GAMM|nr:diguanylate cyclase [Pleionea sp. HL-JVS1]WMS87004.1 diguanylate cyclase [Pleionea sp. HL-JVS1]